MMSDATEAMRVAIRTDRGELLVFEPLPWCVTHDEHMPGWPDATGVSHCNVGFERGEDCNGFYDGTANVWRYLAPTLAQFAAIPLSDDDLDIRSVEDPE